MARKGNFNMAGPYGGVSFDGKKVVSSLEEGDFIFVMSDGYIKARENLLPTLDAFRIKDGMDKSENINIFKMEQFCIHNMAPVCNYLNFLLQEKFVYYEQMKYQHICNTAFYFAEVNGELVIASYTGRTRLISQCTAKMMFVDKLQKIFSIQVQSDGPSASGVNVMSRDQPEDSLQQDTNSVIVSNTEITQDADVSSPNVIIHTNQLQELATTEPIYNYPLLTERFIRIATFNLNVGDVVDGIKYSVELPDGIYDALDSTTAAFLRPFTSISCDVEVMFKVNANQAQCGRYVVSHFPKFFGTNIPDNVYRQLQREHAIIDVAASNDVQYHIPFENTRPWIPIQSNEVGALAGGNFATLQVRTLSPLRIAETGVNFARVQVFARLKNVNLTGMRYPVQPQSGISQLLGTILPTSITEDSPSVQESNVEEGPGERSPTTQEPNLISQGVGAITSAVKSVATVGEFVSKFAGTISNPITSVASILNPALTKGVESTMNYFGGFNRDHPALITPPVPLLPQANHAFANVIGAVPLRKLRMEQTSNTPQFKDFFPQNTPTSVSQLAQIPCYYASFEVTTAQEPGALLAELPVMPLDPRYSFGPLVSVSTTPGDTRQFFQMPTVSYFAMMYTDYVGPLIYEFDCVKTPSHNFSMQVGYVPFNGNPGNTSEAQLQSCKWETIDFRKNNRCEFVSPFISFNLMRQYPHNTYGRGELPSNQIYTTGVTVEGGLNYGNSIDGANQVPMRDPGKLVVRLVNTLNPTPIVSEAITVIIYVKAAPGFKYLVPRPFKGKPASLPSVPVNLAEDGVATINFVESVVNQVIPVQSLGNVQAGDEMTEARHQPKKLVGTFIQTMESHDDILNLCRRTYFHTAIDSATFGIAVDTGAVRIISDVPHYATFPVTPYCWPSRLASRLTGDTAYNVGRGPINPRDALIPCFRWFRGGMNFSIVVKPTNGYDKKQIMVTHTPPVQYPVHVTGKQENPIIMPTVGRVPGTVNTPACGFASELLVPSINPVMTVEVPFYTPNQYIDIQGPMNNQRQAQNIPFNELSAYTLGQLQFHSLVNSPTGADGTSEFVGGEQFKLNIYSSFADDAHLFHFIGTPPTLPNISIRRMVIQGGLNVSTNVSISEISETPKQTGENPRVIQSDQKHINTVVEPEISNRILTRDEIQTALVSAGVESNPGPVQSHFHTESEGTSSSTGSWWSSIKDFVQLPSNIANLRHSADLVSMKLEQLKTQMCLLIPDISYIQVTAAITSLFVAFQHPSVLSIVSAVLQFFLLLPIFIKEKVSSLLTSSLSSLKNLVYQEEEGITPQSLVGAKFDVPIPGLVAVFSSLFIEGLLVNDKLSKMPKADETIKTIIMKYLNNINFARTGAVCVLMYRLCLALETIWSKLRRWCESFRSVSLMEVKQQFIDDFMSNYEYLMNEVNVDIFNFTRINKDRYWTTVIQAYYLQNIMSRHKVFNPIIKTACTSVITKANTLTSRVSSPPVRYEPFVLWAYGKAGVGKSTVIKSLLVDIAENINITYPADPIYVVNPTSQYMNGLTRQPIVLFDDAGAVSDNIVEPTLLSNFMAMKSSARMLVDKPRIEDKEAEFTSPIIGMLSNYKYWPVTNSVRCKSALDRRRDVLVKIVFSQMAETWFASHPTSPRHAQHLPETIRENNGHLAYIVEHDHIRAGEPDRPQYPPPSAPKNHADFREWLLEEHEKYHDLEKRRMLDRYKNSLRLASTLSESLTDDMSLQVALMATIIGGDGENSDVPSETIRHALFNLERTMPDYYRNLPPQVQRPIQVMSNNPNGIEPNADVPICLANGSNIPDNASTWVRALCVEYQQRNPGISQRTIDQRVYEWMSEETQPWLRREPIHKDIVTPCCICGVEPDEMESDNFIQILCSQSTVENQHWVCHGCMDASSRTTNPVRSCPECRNEQLVNLLQYRNVTFWKKAWFWTKAVGIFLKRQAVRSADLLTTAFIACYIFSMVAVAGLAIYSIYEGSKANADVRRYAVEYGELPYEYYGRENGNAIFLSSDGTIESIRVQSEGDISPISTLQSEEFEFPEGDVVEECVHTGINLQDCHILLVENDEDGILIAHITQGDSHVDWPLNTCTGVNCRLRHNKEIIISGILHTHLVAWNSNNSLIPHSLRLHTTVTERIKKSYAKLQSELITKFRQKIVPFLAKAYFFFKEYVFSIVMFLAMLMGLHFGYKMMFSNEDGVVTEVEVQSDHSHNPQNRLNSKRVNNRVVRRITPQNDTGTGENIRNVIALVKKNRVYVSHYSATSYAIGIFGSTILMPRHAHRAIVSLEKEGEVTLNHNGFTRHVTLSKLPFRDIPLYEMVMVELPSCFSFRNITKHLNREKSEEYIVPSSLAVYSIKDDVVKQVEIKGVLTNGPMKGNFAYEGKEVSYENTVPWLFIAKEFQGNGQCMSPYINVKGEIIGFHIGGISWSNEGFAVPVYADAFEIVVQSLGSMEYVKTVDDAPFHTRKSKITPSVISDVMYTSTVEPCCQSRSDNRVFANTDPLIEGCKTIGAPTSKPNDEILFLSMETVYNSIIKDLPIPYSAIPLSDSSAVKPNAEFVTSIDLSTSVGYPLHKKHKLKSDVVRIHSDGSLEWIDNTTRSHLEKVFKDRLQGKPVETIFWAHLKDELRTPEKNRKRGGTRVFHVAPFELILSSRRILLPFMDSFVADPVRACHGVGLSPESHQWTRMVKKLHSKGKHLIQLDFSKFSDTLPHEFVWAAFKCICKWYEQYGMYTNEVRNAMDSIMFDIMYSQTLVYDDVYRITNGVLQGHPLTSIINSLVNIIEQVYVYVVITQEMPETFFERCAIMVMGDDVVISVPDDLIGEYNAQVIARVFNGMGIIVTDPFDKFAPIEEIPKSYDLNKLLFLSRTVYPHPFRKSVVLAPVKMQSLVNIPLWVRKSAGRRNVDLTIEVVHASVLLAYTHGPYFYDIWCYLMTQVFQVKGLSSFLKIPTWRSLDFQFYKTHPRDSDTTTDHCSCSFNCLKTLFELLCQGSVTSIPLNLITHSILNNVKRRDEHGYAKDGKHEQLKDLLDKVSKSRVFNANLLDFTPSPITSNVDISIYE